MLSATATPLAAKGEHGRPASRSESRRPTNTRDPFSEHIESTTVYSSTSLATHTELTEAQIRKRIARQHGTHTNTWGADETLRRLGALGAPALG
jgi:hypothetical protein